MFARSALLLALFLAVAALAFFAHGGGEATAGPPAFVGDADCSGVADIGDAQVLLDLAAETGGPAACPAVTDINCDSAQTILDVLHLVRHIARLPGLARPAGCPPIGPNMAYWQRLSPAGVRPPELTHHSLVTDGERLYLFGGTAAGVTDDLWIYDIAGDSWQQVAETDPWPPPRFGHNAVFDADHARMVVFGGQAGAGFFADTWAYDVATGAWTLLADEGPGVPAPRYGAAGALDPAGRLLISHGFTNQGRFDDTWAFDLDTDTWQEISPATGRPVERCLHRAVWDAASNRLLMFGGQTTGVPYLGDFWELTAGGWNELAGGPAARNNYAMAQDPASGRTILFGGQTASGRANDVWTYDPAADTWTQQMVSGTQPQGVSRHDAVWVPMRAAMYAYGVGEGGGDDNELWRLIIP